MSNVELRDFELSSRTASAVRDLLFPQPSFQHYPEQIPRFARNDNSEVAANSSPPPAEARGFHQKASRHK
jgi:hypothetical protein